jgi:hypothetical protein
MPEITRRLCTRQAPGWLYALTLCPSVAWLGAASRGPFSGELSRTGVSPDFFRGGERAAKPAPQHLRFPCSGM